MRAELEGAVAAAGLGADVGILGYVKPVEPLLWRADVLVLLSDAEGLPQVLVQAAAAGTPFVTYEVDGARRWWRSAPTARWCPTAISSGVGRRGGGAADRAEPARARGGPLVVGHAHDPRRVPQR